MADKQSDMFLRAKNAFRTHPMGGGAPAEDILTEANIPAVFRDIVEIARRDFTAGDWHGPVPRPPGE